MSETPEIELLSAGADEKASGRHRSGRGRRAHRGAMTVTAVVAAGAMALAAYAVAPVAPTMETDGVRTTLSGISPVVGDTALRTVLDSSGDPFAESQKVREEQAAVAEAGLAATSWGSRTALASATERSEEIAAERAAAEQAEQERIAAEQAEQERIAAEQAAAEEAAAEQAAAEEAAAAEREQAASRSEEREAAPEPEQEQEPVQEAAPEPEPEPEPEPAPAPPSGDPRSTARGMLSSYGWGDDQWGCLDSLWNRESNWNHTAQNPSSGAYGIPQSLPGSKMASAGSDWRTNPTTQIRWGLGYIDGRYGSPCAAWAHSESVGWY